MSPKFCALLFIFAIIGTVVCQQGETSQEHRRCVLGKSYYDGCNWCQCMGALDAEERNIGCTFKLCSKLNPDGTLGQVDPIPPPADFWETY